MVTIACACLTITTPTLPAGMLGSDYSQTIGVNPAGSYAFSLLTGSLRIGLTLNAMTGVLSGLPTVTGSYSFKIKATGSTGCAAMQSYTLQINYPSIMLPALHTNVQLSL